MSNLTILNTAIRQHENLFSLNDLHQVSGNSKNHQPSNFSRLDTTQALVTAIQAEGTANPIKTLRGTQGGTYACKEIVIAYAAWISPQFHLVVLRAFLDQLENSQKTPQIAPLAKHKGIAHLTNEQITVDLNHYQTLVHLARTASSATAHLFEQQTNVLKACGFAFSPLNSQANQAELVREMQFVIDDAEANFRRHIRRNTF